MRVRGGVRVRCGEGEGLGEGVKVRCGEGGGDQGWGRG